MNREALLTLTHEERRIIEINYRRVLHKEITPNDFFEEAKRVLGPIKFAQLFPTKHQQQSRPYHTPYTSPHEQVQYRRVERPEYENALEEQNTQKEIKTERLQDIIEYAGVNLKEEQENFGKENALIDNSEILDEDKKNSIDYLFDIPMIVQFVNLIANKKKLQVDDNVYHALFLSLKRKLTEILEKMTEACELRVDFYENKNTTKIENDIKRQLWVLEEVEKKEMEKLLCKKKGDDEDEQKKRQKKSLQEREDILIKKRLSNNVALAALGIQKKSWMINEESIGKQEKKSSFISLYAPYNEKEMEKKIYNRKIVLDDFIFVMEKDKRYNKSVFLIKEYFKR